MAASLKNAPYPFKGTDVRTFPNGLTVILKKDPTIPVVALQIWARCGAIDESPSIYGISHGLEHMVFKGTPTRSAGDISRAIESQGGAINAATQLETTHYYIDIPSYSLEGALDVLADTILHPTFPQDELERERLVILEEINRRDDSADATLWDEFVSDVFEGTPYGIKVIGSKETVSAMSREDLHKYFHAHYVPSKLTVVIVGDINPSKLIKKLHKLFDSLPDKPAPRTPTVDLKPNGNRAPRSVKRPVHLHYFATGLPTIGLGTRDAVGLDLLADVLCGGSSARLYQRLREEKEIVLSLVCDYIAFQQRGIFAFFGETEPHKKVQAREALLEQLRMIKDDPITTEELKRAKARIKSQWLHGSETAHGQANTLGTMATLGHLDVINTYLKNIESFTASELTKLAQKYIQPEHMVWTSVDPRS